MNVRLATVADVSAIMNIERSSPGSAHWTRDRYELMLAARPDDPSRRFVLVIEDVFVEDFTEDEPVKTEVIEHEADDNVPSGKQSKATSNLLGFLVARQQGSEWELENIVVAVAVRRHDLGAQLLRDLISRMRDSGAREVFLEVRESNQAARAFYQKWGFEENGRRQGYYNNPREDAILCHLSVS